MIFKSGTLITFRGGQYEDKWHEGPYLALMDFDVDYVCAKFEDSLKNKNGKLRRSAVCGFSEFVEFMTARGYLQFMPNRHWYVGDWYEPDFDPNPVGGKNYHLDKGVLG